jgi:hypothetical protein
MSEVVIPTDPKKVVEEVKSVVVKDIVAEVNGRTFSCSCWGWKFALQMSQIPTVPPPSTPAETESKDGIATVPTVPPKV